MIGKKTKWGVIGLILSGIIYAGHDFCPWPHAGNIAIGLALCSFPVMMYGIYYRMVGALHHWEGGKPDVTRSRLNRGAGGGM